MKILFFCITILSVRLYAASDINYKCIAANLVEISSEYENITSTDIDVMLQIPEMKGHVDAVNAARRCESGAKKEADVYQCIGDKLQAQNSDIFYALTRTEIDIMLQIPEMTGHNQAVAAAKECKAL